MISSTQTLARLASTGSTRAQKGYLLLFSLVLFITSEATFPDQIVILGMEFKNVANTAILVLGHYILLYLMLSYGVYYIVDIFINWRRIIFLPLTVLFDFVVPIGFSLYVFYRIDKKCNCLLGSYDNFYADLLSLLKWASRFVPAFWENIEPLYDWVLGEFKVYVLDPIHIMLTLLSWYIALIGVFLTAAYEYISNVYYLLTWYFVSVQFVFVGAYDYVAPVLYSAWNFLSFAYVLVSPLNLILLILLFAVYLYVITHPNVPWLISRIDIILLIVLATWLFWIAVDYIVIADFDDTFATWRSYIEHQIGHTLSLVVPPPTPNPHP